MKALADVVDGGGGRAAGSAAFFLVLAALTRESAAVVIEPMWWPRQTMQSRSRKRLIADPCCALEAHADR